MRTLNFSPNLNVHPILESFEYFYQLPNIINPYNFEYSRYLRA